jgi:hypothetical protein
MPLPRGRIAPVLAAACLVLLGWLLLMNKNGRTAGQPPMPKDKFGDTATAAPPTIKPAAFDGQRALGYIKELCRIGPRISGSEGMTKQQQIIKAHFEKLGAKVEFQKFTAKQNSQPAPVAMANIVITWHPDRERRVLLCSHYDTRPKADQEKNRADWDKPFVSANDGTSGVAWLMELGNHMKAMSLIVGVDFALFDGEEFVFEGPNGQDKYFFGSEHFADEYKLHRGNTYYAAGLLFDLAAGKNAKFPVEQNSWNSANQVVNQLWGTAKELSVPQFVWAPGPAVSDDHIALNRAGIKTADIIDFDYSHWHRLTDTPEQCSPETMEAVSKVISIWLQRCR